MSTLASWSEFILLHVLPIAISQIVDWVREWQILVAALVLLIFFHFWTRAILRAAREAARETVLGETRAFDAGLKLLRRQMEAGTDGSKTVAVAPGAAGPRGRVEPAPMADPVQIERKARSKPATDGNAAVDHLRQAIRLALSTLPTSDDPLPPVSVRLYRAAIDALDEGALEVTEGGRKDVLDRIRTELSALRQSYPPQSCRQAWQSLVKVNTLAREFYEPAPLTRAEMLAAGKQATP
ncbi:MAG TPA: hypothetical protein VHD95_03870 [Rhizomicrobium sp.]|jgi:hypothetical protein|nr:hypothetical protein [Rhizomicrobium sp.]